MATVANWKIRDYSNELSGFRHFVPDVTAANFDATITALTALNVAVAAVTKGNIVGQTVSIDTGIAGADLIPSDPFAQREIGARFYYTDTVTGQKGNFTIPCADLDLIGQQGTDNLDLTLSVMAQVVAAFEALAVSSGGNAIVVTSAKIVGRAN